MPLNKQSMNPLQDRLFPNPSMNEVTVLLSVVHYQQPPPYHLLSVLFQLRLLSVRVHSINLLHEPLSFLLAMCPAQLPFVVELLFSKPLILVPSLIHVDIFLSLRFRTFHYSFHWSLCLSGYF